VKEITQRQKVFIALPLKKKEKEYYGTCEVIYAHIPVVGEVLGRRFAIDRNTPDTYCVLPYAQQTKTGKVVFKDDTISDNFKELELMSLFLYDDLDECIASCRQSNEYYQRIFANDHTIDMLNALVSVQEEEIGKATNYIENYLGINKEKGL